MTGTFIDLVNRIADECERGTTDNTEIKQHINDAIFFYKSKRFWFLEGPTTGSNTSVCTIGNSYVSRYAGLIQLDSLRLTVSSSLYRLQQVGFSAMERYFDGASSNGQPWAYCEYGNRVRLYPTPAAAYTLTWSGLFEEATQPLVNDSDTNDWMTYGEPLIRARAKKTFMRDVMRDRPEEVQMQEVAEAEALAALDRETMRKTATRRLRASW